MKSSTALTESSCLAAGPTCFFMYDTMPAACACCVRVCVCVYKITIMNIKSITQ